MKIKYAVMSVLLGGAVSMAGMAVAQPMEGPWHHGEDMEFLRGLSLTDAQKQQARDIEKAAWSHARPLMEQLHTLHEQVITLLLTAGSTSAQISPVVAQEESVRNRLDADRLATGLQLRALLTPEQLSQAADLHGKLEALHAQEHEMMDGARGAPE